MTARSPRQPGCVQGVDIAPLARPVFAVDDLQRFAPGNAA